MIVQIVLVIVSAVQLNPQELCPSVCHCYSEQATYTTLIMISFGSNSCTTILLF